MKALESFGYVTPRDYSHYVRFHILRGKYYRIKAIAVIASLVLLSIALLLIGIATSNKGLMVAAGVIVLCFAMFFYTLNVNIKNTCNSNAKVIRAKQRTVFGKNGFVFELLFENEEENEHDEIFYDELECVYLAPHAIYVYIEKRSVIVIPKRNLKISFAEALKFLIKYIPPQKLIICV